MVQYSKNNARELKNATNLIIFENLTQSSKAYKEVMSLRKAKTNTHLQKSEVTCARKKQWNTSETKSLYTTWKCTRLATL